MTSGRDGEVEKAFEVYVNGSKGSLFGYGAVDPKNFDEVWDNMKGSRRQLCIERIKTENAARATLGLAPLTATEEDFYREKVKKELKSEFERRVTLNDKIEAQKKNLDLILDEPYFVQLLERIMTDLKVHTVYSGQQQEGELDGSISSTAMAEMLHGYFVANSQAEAEKFLKNYYKKFDVPLSNEDLAGTWGAIVVLEGTPCPFGVTFTPSGASGGTVLETGGSYMFSGDTVTWVRADDDGITWTFTAKLTKSGGHITGTGTCTEYLPPSAHFGATTHIWDVTMHN